VVSDVDELRAALELATDEELKALIDLLFRPKFNPLDYFYTPDPLAVQSCSRQEQIALLEERFRFLAADGMTTLRRRSHQLSYRQILLQVCRHLQVPYDQTLSTADLEAEVFLHGMERTWQRLSPQEQAALQQRMRQELGSSQQFQALPLPLQRNPMGLLVKGSSALAVSSVLRPWLLQQLARQFALHFAQYQVAKQALVRGGLTVATQVQSRAALQVASRGMAVNAARYGAARTVLAFLGPALWAWFAADLGWRAIATNYGRIIPVVFALAQIRLTRSQELEPASC